LVQTTILRALHRRIWDWSSSPQLAGVEEAPAPVEWSFEVTLVVPLRQVNLLGVGSSTPDCIAMLGLGTVLTWLACWYFAITSLPLNSIYTPYIKI
jgi:hypothetical protein